MSDFYKPYEDGWLDSFNPPIPEVYGEAVTYLQQIKRLYKYVKDNVCSIRQRLKWLEINISSIASKEGREAALKELQNIIVDLNILSKKVEKQISLNATEHIQMRNEYTKEYNTLLCFANKTAGRVNEIEENLERMVAEAVEDQRAWLQIQLHHMEGLIESLSSQLHFVTQQTASLRNEMLIFKRHINSIIETEFEKISKEIDEKIARANADALIVTSPISGKPTTLREALSELVESATYFPNTCSDFDSLEITCSDFDSKNLTCSVFDQFAYFIFFKDLNFPDFFDIIETVNNNLQGQIDEIKETKWISLVTEKFLTPQECYEELATYVLSQHSNRITCVNFDEKNVSCAIFDDKLIHCVNFDWSAGNIDWR